MTEFSNNLGIDKRGPVRNKWKARFARIGEFLQRNSHAGKLSILDQEALPPVAWGEANKFPLYRDLTQAEQVNRAQVLEKFRRQRAPEPEGFNKEPRSLGLSEKQIVDLTENANRYVAAKTDADPEWTAPVDLSRYRLEIPPDIGIHFDAHGMVRGTAYNLRSLNALLTSGIDHSRPFHTTVLRDYDDMEIAAAGIGAVGPFSTGDFILLGKPDVGIQAGGIHSVLVNEQHYASVSELQKTFPAIHFIKANEAPESLGKLLQEK